MISALSDAQKLDILLGFIKKGYNLLDTEDPATMKMGLGTGYTLLASANQSWMIEFNDGIETTRHHIESPRIPYTNAKDALTLYKEYESECKRVIEDKYVKPKQKKSKIKELAKTSEEAGEATEVIDYEEKTRLEREKNEKILEALENGEIQKPEIKSVTGAHRGVA